MRSPLRDAVARLPQELRAVVVLRYFSGYTLAGDGRDPLSAGRDRLHPPEEGPGPAPSGAV